MKAQLTQEAKDAVLEALKSRAEERSTFVIPKGDEELCEGIMDGLTEAFAVVESLPVSDGGKQDSSNTWIPVEEKLPEGLQEVFAFSSKTGIRGIAFQVDGSWYFDDGHDTIFSDVTHWHPLPKSP